MAVVALSQYGRAASVRENRKPAPSAYARPAPTSPSASRPGVREMGTAGPLAVAAAARPAHTTQP